jgi:hypothetical protein
MSCLRRSSLEAVLLGFLPVFRAVSASVFVIRPFQLPLCKGDVCRNQLNDHSMNGLIS